MTWSESTGLRVFAGRHSIKLAEGICEHLQMPLGQARTDVFPDGELIVRVEEDVRGRDCFVVLSTSPPVNDNMMELLIFADSLRRASARRITAVIPYYGYARQDRKDKGRTPITAKLAANLITTAGSQRVLTIDLHAAQIQGFFDLPVDHLAAVAVFNGYFQSVREELGDLVVVSPDVGNVKIANTYADLLDADLAIIDKRRLSGDLVRHGAIVGEVKGKTVLMMDDMISTAGTVCEAARLVMDRGASSVVVAATHALLCGKAVERLAAAPIGRVVITDTIPGPERFAPIADKVVELGIAELFADAIHHIHHNLSVSALFHRYADSKR